TDAWTQRGREWFRAKDRHRPAAAPAVPSAAVAAAFAARVCAAIIWLAPAIRACAAAIWSPTGGMLRSIPLACLCRSRPLLKTPRSGRPVQLVDLLRDGAVSRDPVNPALVRGLPGGLLNTSQSRDFRQFGRVVTECRDALADGGELLDRHAGDGVEV